MMPTRTAAPAPDLSLDLSDEISEFERLRERAHEQIAALAVTVSRLEGLRTEIERHLPSQRHTATLVKPANGTCQPSA